MHELPEDIAALQGVLGSGIFYGGSSTSARPEWEEFLDSGPVYARIEAERMFALVIAPPSPGP